LSTRMERCARIAPKYGVVSATLPITKRRGKRNQQKL
jgi:hypothetical protein